MGRYTTTSPPATQRSPGTGATLSTSDTAVLRQEFASSPIANGYDAAEVQRLGVDLLQSPTVNDGGHTFGTIDRDYSDAPKLADVASGPGGLPGSPYTPNTVSPGEGNGANPTAMGAPVPAPPSTGNGSTSSPDSTSKSISRETIGTYQKGVKSRQYT